MERYLDLLKRTPILPIKCPKDKEELLAMLNAITKTSIRVVEITLRNELSFEAIRFIKENFPEITVGAGTVVNSHLLKQAALCGAGFCVSPGLDLEILAEAKKMDMPFLPGCSTPSEILSAQKFGLKIVKFFPAEISGGVNALKLYEGAFANMLFLPTGGITCENCKEYLKLNNVISCGGSFMLAPTEKETYQKITSCLEGIL